MVDMLMRLPREVFLLIIEKLTRADLRRLSQASRWLRESVAIVLWQSITIKPWSEHYLHRIPVSSLPQSFLQHAKHLHLRSDVECSMGERCPHEKEYDWADEEEDDYDGDDELQDESHFACLTRKAESLLRRIDAHRLQSFSWELGTCVPPQILGTNGVIPLEQPELQSLSLMTFPTCRGFHDEGCEIDLSAFRKLQSLSWKGPNFDNLDALTVALRSNSAHLRKLELDFVNWPVLRDLLGYFGEDDEEVDGIKESDYFAYAVLGLSKSSLIPFFPNISVLSLSDVPLSAAMADAFDFDTLTSLTLRLCPKWDVFIRRMLQLYDPINLKTLEIQESHDVTEAWGEDFMLDFLRAFKGLEELFLSQAGPILTLELWDCVARRHQTLKRFVCHQRTVDTDEDSLYFDTPCDLPNLAISGADMNLIKDHPSRNPLSMLDLEFLGLSCLPELLKNLLLPFTSKASLKALHIRQTDSDVSHYPSWAINDHLAAMAIPGRTSEEFFPGTDPGLTAPTGATEDAPSETHTAEVAAVTLGWPRLTMRHEFQQFAEWVFGPQGIASLDIVAFGDFGHGNRPIRHNLILCRDADGTRNFRLLDEGGREWKEVLDKYRTAMEACPVDPLFVL